MTTSAQASGTVAERIAKTRRNHLQVSATQRFGVAGSPGRYSPKSNLHRKRRALSTKLLDDAAPLRHASAATAGPPEAAAGAEQKSSRRFFADILASPGSSPATSRSRRARNSPAAGPSPGQLSESARKARRSLVRLSRLSREQMFCNPGVALAGNSAPVDGTAGDGVTVGGGLRQAIEQAATTAEQQPQ